MPAQTAVIVAPPVILLTPPQLPIPPQLKNQVTLPAPQLKNQAILLVPPQLKNQAILPAPQLKNREKESLQLLLLWEVPMSRLSNQVKAARPVWSICSTCYPTAA